MRRIFLSLLGVLLLNIPIGTATKADACGAQSSTESIKNRKFQLCFFEELNTMMDIGVNEALNRLLSELQTNQQYAAHNGQIQQMIDSAKLQPKIVYLKQLLDMKLNEQWPQVDTLYTLRNLNFLSKFKRQLQQLQDESAQELRKLRWYNLCQQFWFRDDQPHNVTARAPQVKLAPIRAPSTTAADSVGKNTRHAALSAASASAVVNIDLPQFARDLYAKVRPLGAEIIDDYLLALRKLLQEVVEEQHGQPGAEQDNAHVAHSAKLTKVLHEIDAIVDIEDFYAKRQRLYAYLEHDLAIDYEQFKSSQYAQEDLAVILAKLQSKGLDLFVTFIFSNFEFLEDLHEAWAELLLPSQSNAAKDAQTQELHDLHTLYVAFKHDWENNERYEAYVAAVKTLYMRTKHQPGDWKHIFELLHNASANVGSVTFNMIKAKCDEL